MPSSPYGLSKLAQEMLGRRRPNGRVGRHDRARVQPPRAAAGSAFRASGFARRIADIEKGRWEPEISVGNLDAQRDLTDVRDTVRAYRLILERGHPGGPYNVCSGRAITIRHLLDLLLSRARVPVAVKTDPARLRPNDTPLLLGDPSRLRDELGWTAEIPLEQTLDDLLEYWRAAAMKVLVTGGTGYLGRAVVRALGSRGHDLVVFARTASRSGLPGTLVDGDIRDRTRSNAPPPGATRSPHSAALVSIWRRRREDFDEINVGGLRNVLAAAATQHVRASCIPRRFWRFRRADIAERAAIAGERLPADEGRRGSRRRRGGPRRTPCSSASTPASSTGREHSPRAI